MSNAIQNWNEFEKLYKVSIPYHKEAEYYLRLLSRLPDYKWLPSAMTDFTNLEETLATETTPRSVSDYKRWAMEICWENMKASPVWLHFKAVADGLRGPAEEYDRMNTVNEKIHGVVFAEIDLVQANYNIVRFLGAGGGSLPERWETWAENRGPGIHPAMVKSKSFRQVAFGNTDPKAIRRAQLNHTTKLANSFTAKGFNVVRISADALTVAIQERQVDDVQRHWALTHSELFQPNGVIPSRLNFFRLEDAANYGQVKIHYRPGPCETLVESHRSLYGVPGNLFYLALKEAILKETVDRRDTYFWMEKRLAMWVHPSTNN